MEESLRVSNITVKQLTQDLREASVEERAAKDRAATLEATVEAANRRQRLGADEVAQLHKQLEALHGVIAEMQRAKQTGDATIAQARAFEARTTREMQELVDEKESLVRERGE